MNDAFLGTDLEPWLPRAGVRLARGPRAGDRHCVSTTAGSVENRGFETCVVGDATATFDRELDGERFDAEAVHRTALASLSGEFATVVGGEECLAVVESSAE